MAYPSTKMEEFVLEKSYRVQEEPFKSIYNHHDEKNIRTTSSSVTSQQFDPTIINLIINFILSCPLVVQMRYSGLREKKAKSRCAHINPKPQS